MKYVMAVVYAGVPALGLGAIVGAATHSWTGAILGFGVFLGLGLDVLLNGSGRNDADD